MSLATVAALVLVPTVLRAQQRLSLRDTTRLSIKLNWQSDAPPRTEYRAPSSEGEGIVAPEAIASLPHPARVATRVHAWREPVVQLSLDNSPELLRGPPSLLACAFLAPAIR